MNKILVISEIRDNKIKHSSFECCSKALEISKTINSDAEVLLIGSNISALANEFKAYGIKKAIIADSEKLLNYSNTAYSKIIADIVQKNNFNIIFFPATAFGKDLAPRLAAKLNAGLISDCTELTTENNEIIAVRPVYAGKAYIDVKINTPIKIFTLRPNVFIANKNEIPEIETINAEIQLNDSDFSSLVKEIIASDEKLDVTEASIVVSGGRGLKNPENFRLVEELAKVLGGAAGASRAIVDAGWRPHSEQVGQTGKTVSPNLYIAIGISGAIQHLAGMSSSKCIVAINKDKDAPIFQIADYGIVGDALEIVPALTEEFKKLLSN
jgi:electron transfer flavoprotein alpha subunit